MSNSIDFNADRDFSIGVDAATGNVILTVPAINSECENSTAIFTNTQILNFDFVANGTSSITYNSNDPDFAFTAYVNNAIFPVQDMYILDGGVSFVAPI